MLVVILLVFAFVLAAIAGALGSPHPWAWKLACWAGACWFLAEILARGGSVLRLG